MAWRSPPEITGLRDCPAQSGYVAILAPGPQPIEFQRVQTQSELGQKVAAPPPDAGLPDPFFIPQRMIEDDQHLFQGGEHLKQVAQALFAR